MIQKHGCGNAGKIIESRSSENARAYSGESLELAGHMTLVAKSRLRCDRAEVTGRVR
jgi:hypothetical protein